MKQKVTHPAVIAAKKYMREKDTEALFFGDDVKKYGKQKVLSGKRQKVK